MLPGKEYRPEDLVAIARKRIWFLLVPFAVVSAATAVTAQLLPDIYQAQAVVAVVPQQVPTNFVPATVTTRLSDRLRAIQDRVLSRPRLEKIILEFNLYAEQRRSGILQDVIERMKTRDLRILPSGPVAFRVTYLGRDPVSTMRVAQEVASAFISESLLDRSRLADQTNQFLDTQAEAARLQLVEREHKLVSYRLRHAGELPEQEDSNLRQMGNISALIQSNAQAINVAHQRRIQFERDYATAVSTPAAAALPMLGAPGPGRSATPPSTTVQKLADAKRQLELVSAQYTALHPDVRRWTAEVTELEMKAAAETASSPAELPPGVTPAEASRQRQIQELRDQLAEIEKQLAGYAAEEQRLRAEFDRHKARVEAAPMRQAELTELMRDYDEINASYSDLRRKSEQSMLAAALAEREIGEQFQLLEAATVPQRPFSPNRSRLTLMGVLAGLCLGVALIGLLEYRDSGFTTDKQVTALLGLPVLAVVPVMQSDQERQRTRIRRGLMHLGLGTMVVGCLAVLAYTFIR